VANTKAVETNAVVIEAVAEEVETAVDAAATDGKVVAVAIDAAVTTVAVREDNYFEVKNIGSNVTA
jgi:hypothetical protein